MVGYERMVMRFLPWNKLSVDRHKQSSVGQVPGMRCLWMCAIQYRFFFWVVLLVLMFLTLQSEKTLFSGEITDTTYDKIQQLEPRVKENSFVLSYGGIDKEEEEEEEEESKENDVVLRLQPGGRYHLRQNVCLTETDAGLNFRRVVAGEGMQTGGLVFLVRAESDMAHIFLWMQQWESSGGDSLLQVPTVEGKVVSLPRINTVILFFDAGKRFKWANGGKREFTRILHWIRVATGRFRLQPWWQEADRDDGTVATRYVTVDVTRDTGDAVALSSLSSLKDLGCMEHLLLVGKNSPQWFPSALWAHRFRLRWVQYLLLFEAGRLPVVEAWHTQLISPVLHQMVNAAGVSMGDFNMPVVGSAATKGGGGGEIREQNGVQVEMFPSSTLRPRLLITVLMPHKDPLHGGVQVASFLQKRFGEVARIQLLHLHTVETKRWKNGKGGAEDNFVVRVVRDYREVLHHLMLTDVLILPHASILSAMVTMQPGSVVIELFPHRCYSHMHVGLAAALGVSYLSYEADADDEGHRYRTQRKTTANTMHRSLEVCAGGQNTSTHAARTHPRLLRNVDTCYYPSWVNVSKMQLYHHVKDAMTSVWLRDSRFFQIIRI